MRDKEKPARTLSEKPFFPRGAIASFVAMIVFYIGLWLTLYLVMAQRG